MAKVSSEVRNLAQARSGFASVPENRPIAPMDLTVNHLITEYFAANLAPEHQNLLALCSASLSGGTLTLACPDYYLANVIQEQPQLFSQLAEMNITLKVQVDRSPESSC